MVINIIVCHGINVDVMVLRGTSKALGYTKGCPKNNSVIS